MEPLNSHIMTKNIWIKPDFYSTRIVSSPGFFTLIHPNLMNKVDTIRDLMKSIQKTEINNEEQVVKEWKTNRGLESSVDVKVPNFHLENTTKKWGRIKTE